MVAAEATRRGAANQRAGVTKVVRVCSESIRSVQTSRCGWQTRQMPRISAFYGIVIAMFYEEHGVPHFHARYAEHDASIAIATLP